MYRTLRLTNVRGSRGCRSSLNGQRCCSVIKDGEINQIKMSDRHKGFENAVGRRDCHVLSLMSGSGSERLPCVEPNNFIYKVLGWAWCLAVGQRDCHVLSPITLYIKFLVQPDVSQWVREIAMCWAWWLAVGQRDCHVLSLMSGSGSQRLPCVKPDVWQWIRGSQRLPCVEPDVSQWVWEIVMCWAQ